MDENEHSQLSGVVSMLQDSVEVDDEMKSKLKDTYHNVTELSASRATQLKKSLLVGYTRTSRETVKQLYYVLVWIVMLARQWFLPRMLCILGICHKSEFY